MERELVAGGHCGAANWSEVAQKVLSHGRNWDLAKALLLALGERLDAAVWTADTAWDSDEGVRQIR